MKKYFPYIRLVHYDYLFLRKKVCVLMCLCVDEFNGLGFETERKLTT